MKLKQKHTDSTELRWLPVKQQGNFMLLHGIDIYEPLRGSRYHHENKHVPITEAECFEKLQTIPIAPELKKAMVGFDYSDYENSKPCLISEPHIGILSRTEASELMTVEERRRSDRDEENDLWWYWLRSAGNGADSAVSLVNFSGGWNAHGATSTLTANGFRPAIWVNLNSEIFESEEDKNKINEEVFEVPIDFEKMRPIGEVKYSFTPSEISICEVKPEHEYLSGFADGIKFALENLGE